MSHLATVLSQPGSPVTVRLRDAAGAFWDFTLGAWTPTESAAVYLPLTEVAESGTLSRYSALVALPSLSASSVLEYVQADEVIAEESIASVGAQAMALAGPLLTTLDIVHVYTGTDLTDQQEFLLGVLVAGRSAWWMRETLEEYTAETPVPADVQVAVAEMVALDFQFSKRPGVVSETGMHGATTTYVAWTTPEAIKQVIDAHRVRFRRRPVPVVVV